jgi:hypothetical protein
MSFAFTFGSVGDIIAVTQIVAKIISALNDSRGSAVEYQQLFENCGRFRRRLIILTSYLLVADAM